MHLLYADETNLDPSTSEFFVYGGITIPSNKALELSKSVEKIRSLAKVPSDYLLKFNPGPSHLSHKEFIKLKEAIISSAIEHECKLIVSMVLHRIAKSGEDARRLNINTVLYHFQCYLNWEKSRGLVLIDRFTDDKIDTQLRQRFSVGVIDMPFTKQLRLDRIVGFHYSAIGQSHFGSIIDIVIGSLRFAINAITLKDTKRIATAEVILRLLSPLFIKDTTSNKVHEISLQMSPKSIKSRLYKTQYLELQKFFEKCEIVMQQRL